MWDPLFIPDGMDPEEFFREYHRAFARITIYVAPCVAFAYVFYFTFFG